MSTASGSSTRRGGYVAMLENGERLPSWLRFDADALEFWGRSEDGYAGHFVIVIVKYPSSGATFQPNVRPTPSPIFDEGELVGRLIIAVSSTKGLGTSFNPIYKKFDDSVSMPSSQHWLNSARVTPSVDSTTLPSALPSFPPQRWPRPIVGAQQQINPPITPSKTQPLKSPDIKDRVHRPRAINVAIACTSTPSPLPLWVRGSFALHPPARSPVSNLTTWTSMLDQVAAMHPAFQVSNGFPWRPLFTRIPRAFAIAAIPLATVKL
ncbi:hypothetical protein M407DRAFT_31541 [Tulasnella calospora MUT 4182]|uniref:Uncharacterized protein n=1 Tax=Tulasnella calospora MUT 4182 TaxID=1051891 RepID=A0A0C3LBC0_9AGAM|nr:hypothetical protein M407DRAFT_31541 [Tulasnella calospora MUT 4182]